MLRTKEQKNFSIVGLDKSGCINVIKGEKTVTYILNSVGLLASILMTAVTLPGASECMEKKHSLELVATEDRNQLDLDGLKTFPVIIWSNNDSGEKLIPPGQLQADFQTYWKRATDTLP